MCVRLTQQVDDRAGKRCVCRPVQHVGTFSPTGLCRWRLQMYAGDQSHTMHSRTRTGRATPYGPRRTKPLVRQAACISPLVVLALLTFCSLRTLPPDLMEVTFELQRIAYVLVWCIVEPVQYDSAGAR